MEINQNTSLGHNDKASHALTVAYIALVVGLIALWLSGWMFYSAKYTEEKKPQNVEQKVDKFFEKQNQEFDKIFDDKEESR